MNAFIGIHRRNRKVMATIALIGYMLMSLAGLSLFFIHMHSGSHVHCPYSVGAYAMCPMDLFGHIEVWSAFSRIIPASLVLFIPVVISLGILKSTRAGPLCRTVCTDFVSLYRQLYSGGILNPKAP